MHEVQGDDRDTQPGERSQDTPPAGYEIQSDDQPTEQRTVAGSDPPPPPPPPPPPGYDEQPTEVGREAYGDETQVHDTYGDETQVGRTVSYETRVGQTVEQDVVDPDDPRTDQERRI